MTWAEWWHHAFAIPAVAPCQPTEPESRLVGQICSSIRKRGLSVPAQIFIESLPPSGSLGAQLIRFLQPTLELACRREDIDQFAGFLEKPGAIRYFCDQLDVDENCPTGKGTEHDIAQ